MKENPRKKVTPNWYAKRDAVPPYVTQISIIDESNGKRIATVFNQEAVGAIVAAPHLLAAYETALDMLSECMRRASDFDQDHVDEIDAAMQVIRAAMFTADLEGVVP